jgi:hypothetical protein
VRLNPVRLVVPLLLISFAAASAQDQVQGPKIGIIDFYGVQKAPLDRIRKALGLAEGDPLPKSKGVVEERIELLSSVVRARLEAVCCEAGKAILYVGVEEKGAPTFVYRDPPEGKVELPTEIAEAYALFLIKLQEAVRLGESSEDLSRGHSLMRYQPARDLQEAFIPMADKHLTILKDVLRNGSNEEQRATAAFVIAYATKKRLVVDDLQYAMQDPDDGVRNNALRSLVGISVLAMKDPTGEMGIKVSPTWFIELLNSLIWNDRNKAAFALVTLTESRDAKLLEQIKERALPSLIDMAHWKHLPHALPGYILLGRISGLPEKELQDAWSGGEHTKMLDQIVKKLTAKPSKKEAQAAKQP